MTLLTLMGFLLTLGDVPTPPWKPLALGSSVLRTVQLAIFASGHGIHSILGWHDFSSLGTPRRPGRRHW